MMGPGDPESGEEALAEEETFLRSPPLANGASSPGCVPQAAGVSAEQSEPVDERAEKAFTLVREGLFDEAAALLDQHPYLWQEVEKDGHYTLLHWSSLAGNVPFVSHAVSACAKVDAQAENGQTPLMWAIIKGHLACAKALLEARADPHLRDSFGATPLILAIQHRQHGSLLLLMASAQKERLLREADNNGCGPVHWAAYKGDITSLKLLDYFDADFMALDSTQMTPLHRMVQGGKTEAATMKLLLERKVDPFLVDSQGRTCVDMARQQEDRWMQRTLDQLLQEGGASSSSRSRSTVPEEREALKDLEAGRPSDAREAQKRQRDELKDLKEKAIHNAAATFWLVSVSLATFEYLTDLRTVSWSRSPWVALAFELGVPASIALFLVVALSDPGKVPSRPKGASAVEDVLKALRAPPGSDLPDVGRLCTTTWVLKGPRVKFCSRTGACIDEFDHFCGWLNVAIGRGNHRPFIVLAAVEASTQLCHLYMCWRGAEELVATSSFFGWLFDTGMSYPLLMVVALLHMFTAPAVLVLLFSHIRMIAVNLTTNEMINIYRYEHFWALQGGQNAPLGKVFRNPFNKGSMWKNCLDFWWYRRRGDLGPASASACAAPRACACKAHE